MIDFIQFEKNKKAYLAASYDDGFVRIFKRGAKDDKHTEVKKLKRGGAGNVLSLTLVNENELAGAGDDRDSTIEIWRLGNLEEEGSGAADAPA